MKRNITLIAHNIRSLWNVGSLFRTSDCFGVEKLYLTGYTATPPRREISKTAIGAEEWIPWEQADDPKEVIEQKRKDGYRIVALELTDDAVEIAKYEPPEKVCLIIGHEVTGVSDDLLKLADDVIKIPMFGKKESLNVSVATGITLNHLANT